MSSTEQFFESLPQSSGQPSNLEAFQDSLRGGGAQGHNNLGDIIVNSISSEDAFSVFQGKGDVYLDSTMGVYSLADRIERRAESPMQRYSRLRAELDDLKNELNDFASEDSASAAPKTSNARLWAKLQEEAKMRNTSNPVTCSSSFAELEALESRMTSLEEILGGVSNTLSLSTAAATLYERKNTNDCLPLVETVMQLSSRITFLDPIALDALKTRAMNLRKDIDAESARRNSQTTVGTSLDGRVIESVKRIDDLHSRVSRVESITQYLPALVLRLKSLESSHVQAASITSKLIESEKIIESLQADLQSNNDVIAAIREGLNENMVILQANITKMEKRLEE